MLLYGLSILPLMVFPACSICHLLFINSLSLSPPFSILLSSCIPILCLCITPPRKNHPIFVIFAFRFGGFFLPMFLFLFSYLLSKDARRWQQTMFPSNLVIHTYNFCAPECISQQASLSYLPLSRCPVAGVLVQDGPEKGLSGWVWNSVCCDCLIWS